MLVKYGICNREQIFIATNGHEHALRWDAGRSSLPLLSQLKRPYVLLLGSRAPHKNIDMILNNADVLDAHGIDIVMAGAASRIFAGRAEIERSNVRYAGYVSDDDLAALYKRALFLAFPSLTEGFGIPVLEAMVHGCPVLSSDAASLKEVGGDAVLYANPRCPQEWRQAMVSLASSGERRAELSAKGRERATLFSWTRSAETYLDEIINLSGRA
jgi:glycosyltransferase involved in cell wall biosynthesis